MPHPAGERPHEPSLKGPVGERSMTDEQRDPANAAAEAQAVAREAAAADLDGDDFDLRAEMHDLSISPALLADLTGADRSTIWRWMNGRTPVPHYVKTILMLRRTLRHLSGRLLETAKDS